MINRPDRTFVCSVVFLAISEYARRPVTEQIRLRDRLNAMLAAAIRDVPANDRIILDTGDGAALSFLGAPGDALLVAMTIRDATVQSVHGDMAPMPVRLGINLGPVRLIKDLNGQPNLIGDGINVAQRVMGFAQPGQVLVSRSYYDVVASLGEEYAQLFRYEGSRTDKNVRTHDIYAVGYSPAALSSLRAAPHGRAASLLAAAPLPAATLLPAATPRASRREWMLLGALVATILAAAAVLRIQKQIREETPASKTAPAPAPWAPPAPQAATSPVPRGAGTAVPKAQPRTAGAPPAAAQRPEAGPRPTRPQLRERTLEQPDQTAAADPMGHVTLAILPWGEVYVNGRLQGVSPPLRVLDLKPGRHTIEIRNTSFQAYSEVVDLRAAERIRIRHHFQ